MLVLCDALATLGERRAPLAFAHPVQRRLLFLSSVRTYATVLHKLSRTRQFVGLTAWIDRQAIKPKTVAVTPTMHHLLFVFSQDTASPCFRRQASLYIAW